MNRRRSIERGIILVVGVFLGIGLSSINCTGCSSSEEEIQDTIQIRTPKKITTRFFGSYGSTFRDLNEKHLSSAKTIGISPLSAREAVTNHIGLVPVETNTYYAVDNLKHSLPYVIPQAKKLIESIGKGFTDTLTARGVPGYKIIVTSVLRVEDDIKRLKHHNSNASINSAHAYGTTFDISYSRFDNSFSPYEVSQGELKHVLGEVLATLRKENKCYVKHEVKQGCFHITAR